MKPLVDKLSSLSLTTATLIVLLLWLTWGILLNTSEQFYVGFECMNRTLLREWLSSPQTGFALLKFWFVGLCVVMVLLGVNLVFCTWKRIFVLLRVRFTAAKLLMLVVHLLFGLVALGHFGGFMLGFRHEDVRFTEGQSFRTKAGYQVRVEKVNFSDELRVLMKSRRNHSPMDFSFEQNFAEVVLYRDGGKVGQGRIRILDPLRDKHVRVVLKRFALPAKGEGLNEKPDVILTISSIPVLTPFLFLYPLMIAGMTIHLFITWRKKPDNKSTNRL
jgi:hypothetical protein